MTDDYAPARWVPATTADGAPCRAVQSVELGRLACVSEARDALMAADQQIYSHGLFTNDDLALLTRGASLGVVAAANHICGIAQHPDNAADPDAWRTQCERSRQAANNAAQVMADEIRQETQNVQANEQSRSALALDAHQRELDAARVASAREDAQYATELAAFHASFKARKTVGERVCSETAGLISAAGQVERVSGRMIQLRYISGRTSGTDIEMHNEDGRLTGYKHIPGSPGTDHLAWVNADEVGLCRLVTSEIQKRQCETIARSVKSIPVIGQFSGGLNFCAAYQSPPP